MAGGAGGNKWHMLGDFASFYTGFIPHVGRFEAERLLIGYGPWAVKRFAGAIARPRVNMRGLPISLS